MRFQFVAERGEGGCLGIHLTSDGPQCFESGFASGPVFFTVIPYGTPFGIGQNSGK